MKYSKQRETMLRFLRASRSHPTANDIYSEVKKTDPKISLGTVYRNLSLLTRHGLITRIDTDHDSVHYDGVTEPHYHFVCSECGKIFDIEASPLEIDAEIESKYGCNISSHSLIFYGLCSNCKEQ